MRVALLLFASMVCSGQMYPLVESGYAALPCALSAATHRCFVTFITDRPVTISGLNIRIGTVTTGDTIRVSLQRMSGTTPDGTVLTSGTLAVTAGDANTWKSVTLSSPYPLKRGEVIAVVYDYGSYTAGNLNVVPAYYTEGYVGLTFPGNALHRMGRYDGSAWTYSYPTTATIHLVGPQGAVEPMYWTALTSYTHLTYANNTTLTNTCVAHRPLQISGIVVQRSSRADYSSVNLSLAVSGTTAWTGAATLSRQAEQGYAIVPFSSAVRVGAGQKFSISAQSSGYLTIWRISADQGLGQLPRTLAESMFSCTAGDNTIWAMWPIVQGFGMGAAPDPVEVQ